MTDKQFVEKFLNINQPMETNPIRFSTLALLLKGARSLSGRNLIDGTYERNEINDENFSNQTYLSFQFSGLINYLILLEQIGSIFRPKNPPILLKSNDIYCALTYFSTLDEDKKNALKALRDSLTHKFGLATENKRKAGKFKFSLCIIRNKSIIQPNLWDGNFSDKSDSTVTTVFVIDLIDLIENIYKNVVIEWQNDDPDLVLLSKIDELKARYTIVY